MLHRAASEPYVGVLYTRTHPARLRRLRELLSTLGRKGAVTRSPMSEEEDFDRVLVTVLITDIVDSTMRVAAIGDRAWCALLDRHDYATRSQIKRFGGWTVSNRGDGFVGIFDSPTRALRCAGAIVETVTQFDMWVRCGVHAGEVHIRREEISGIAIHIATRIAAKASPGEAFVSKTVCDLVAGSGLVFEDRGIHQLRGVPTEIYLYALCPIGDAADAGIIDLKNRTRA
jgi:class 3 adenylate cyclase